MSANQQAPGISPLMTILILLSFMGVFMVGLYAGSVTGQINAVTQCREKGDVHIRKTWLTYEKTVSCVKTPQDLEIEAAEKHAKELRQKYGAEPVSEDSEVNQP